MNEEWTIPEEWQEPERGGTASEAANSDAAPSLAAGEVIFLDPEPFLKLSESIAKEREDLATTAMPALPKRWGAATSLASASRLILPKPQRFTAKPPTKPIRRRSAALPFA